MLARLKNSLSLLGEGWGKGLSAVFFDLQPFSLDTTLDLEKAISSSLRFAPSSPTLRREQDVRAPSTGLVRFDELF
jgi:hypothetical protein